MDSKDKKKENKDTEDYKEFYAPPVPPPSKKPPIPSDSQVSKSTFKKIDRIDSEETKAILVKCERCRGDILVPVPIKEVEECKAKEILVTYIHSNNKKKGHHSLIFELDHDFNVQLPKSADSIISTEINEKKFKSLPKRDAFVNCKRCGQTLIIPVPEKIIKNSKIPKTPVVYVHNNKYGMDQHCVIAYLDSNFGDRATRLVDILIVNLFPI